MKKIYCDELRKFKNPEIPDIFHKTQAISIICRQ